MTTDNEGFRERVVMLIQYEGITQADFAERIGRDASNLSAILSGKRKVPSGFAERIMKQYPNLNKEWLLFGTGRMFGDEEEAYHKLVCEVKPRMPMNVSGCEIKEYLVGTKKLLCDERPIIRQFPEYDFTMVLKNDSMAPRYERGDEIALRAASLEMIEWGHEYVVDIKNEGPKFKTIYEKGNRYRLVSYNSDRYPEYCILKTDVCAIYKVVGMIRV